MKLLISILALTVALLINSNSAKAMGFIYTNATYPITATGVKSPSDLSTLKKGQASTMNILFVAEWGDAGIAKAAKDANIKNINYIDITEKTILFFYRKLTVSVYGE